MSEPDAYIRPIKPCGRFGLFSMGDAPEHERLIAAAGWPISNEDEARELLIRNADWLGCIVTTSQEEYSAYVDTEE